MSKKCCPNCFGDRGLEKHLFEASTSALTSGKCDYCSDHSSKLIIPSDLVDVFELLIEAYEHTSEGNTLIHHFKHDWKLFCHKKMDDAHANELLADILDDGDIVRKRFMPLIPARSQKVGDWLNLRDELRFKNRYFLDVEIDQDRLLRLLENLMADPIESTWFRARITGDNQLLSPEEMGAPPNGLATHGRANPAGIPYLYLASDPITAISEIRPHTGERACVAEFRVDEGLNIVDLRSPEELISPFIFESSSEIKSLREDLPFLSSLGYELTRPVLPRSAATDYVPSQYLCEFIKKQGFDGVMYKSSVGSGKNLALFDTTTATCKNVEAYNVESVMVTANQFMTRAMPLEVIA